MKEDHIFLSNGRVHIRWINQWGREILVEWSCVLLRLKSLARREHLIIQLLGATVRLLIISSLIYPVDEFSLKEMRTWGQSKVFILLSLSLVRIKRTRRQGEFKIPLCNRSGGNILRQSIRVSHLEFRQASTMELLF